jgi:hypothetical protein
MLYGLAARWNEGSVTIGIRAAKGMRKPDRESQRANILAVQLIEWDAK